MNPLIIEFLNNIYLYWVGSDVVKSGLAMELYTSYGMAWWDGSLPAIITNLAYNDGAL